MERLVSTMECADDCNAEGHIYCRRECGSSECLQGSIKRKVGGIVYVCFPTCENWETI